MKKQRYSLHIYLFAICIPIPFDDLEDLYLFMFSLNSVNDEIIYLVWDLELNQIIDFFESQNAQ